MTQRLASGRIVWAEVADANGVRKLRPAVIVTPTEQLTAATSFDVVAITSRVPDRLSEDHVLLPWHPRGHPRTGLNRRCAAVCSWVVQVRESDIQDFAGLVPTPAMRTILSKVAEATRQPSPSEAADGSLPTSPQTMTSLVRSNRGGN